MNVFLPIVTVLMALVLVGSRSQVEGVERTPAPSSTDTASTPGSIAFHILGLMKTNSGAT